MKRAFLQCDFGSRPPCFRLAGRSTSKAFTLIEVMIAVAIFSMVMVAIYSTWTAILRGAKVGKEAALEAQRTRVAVRSLQEAMASLQLFTGNLQHYAFFADTSSDFASISFVARLSSSFPGSGLFPNQPVRRVTFDVAPGKLSQNDLVLRQSPLLEALDPNIEPYTISLAPNVSLFQMEFWDFRRNEWVPEWLFTNQVPKLIRVSLGFGQTGAAGAPGQIISQTIALNGLAIPPNLQGPRGVPGGGGPDGGAPGGGNFRPGGERRGGDQRGGRGGNPNGNFSPSPNQPFPGGGRPGGAPNFNRGGGRP